VGNFADQIKRKQFTPTPGNSAQPPESVGQASRLSSKTDVGQASRLSIWECEGEWGFQITYLFYTFVPQKSAAIGLCLADKCRHIFVIL
jgi:hypothetical protein